MDRKFTLQDVLGAVVFTLLMYSFPCGVFALISSMIKSRPFSESVKSPFAFQIGKILSNTPSCLQLCLNLQNLTPTPNDFGASSMQLESKILSEITTFMKYAKYLPKKQRRETWKELVDRNKEMHLKKFPQLAEEIEAAYQFVYDKKILPSMRSLQFAGKPIEINNARLYNCCFLPINHTDAFSEVMFLLLSGTGVGYSVQRAHIEQLPPVNKPTKTRRYLVGDSIEGWADAVKVMITAYMKGKALPIYDFSDIRPKGALLLTSGGKAPGPEPLKDCLHSIQKMLDRKQNGEHYIVDPF